MKLVCGLILAVGVGIGCRCFGIPLPGPPAIMGAAMAVAMASGYTATDYWLSQKTTSPPTSVTSTQKDIANSGHEVTVNALRRDQEQAGT